LVMILGLQQHSIDDLLSETPSICKPPSVNEALQCVVKMTWLWTDGSSMSYSPGWINNQPATQTSQNCVVMRDQGVNVGKWQHVGCDKSVSDNINFVCERKTEC